MLALQRSAGNQAAAEWLRRRPGAVVARSIVVGPADRYPDRAKIASWLKLVEDALKALVVGVADVQVNPADGVVTLTPTGDEAKRKTHPGFRLLDRVIKNGHPVRIVPDGEEPMAKVAPGDMDAAKHHGGSGTTIEFPPDLITKAHEAGAFFAIQDKGEIGADTGVHVGVALGHELIHSDHAQRGVFKPLGQGEKQRNVYGGYEEMVEQEEMRTVGLPGAKLDEDNQDITENDLRQVLALPQRVSYRPHRLNVEAKDKKDSEGTAYTTLRGVAVAYNRKAKELFAATINLATANDTPKLHAKLSDVVGDLPDAEGELIGQINAALEATKQFALALA